MGKTKQATAQERAYNQRRQAYMRSLGYNVPQDGSWGPYQNKIWTKLTTRDKKYDTTLSGLVSGLWDKVTGNTTERFDPVAESTAKTYNPEEVDWDKTNRSHSKVVNAIAGSWLPAFITGATVAGAPAVVAAAKTAPLITATTVVGGMAGGAGVNAISEAATGSDFGTNVAKYTGITPGMGELFNPGYAIGGFMLPRTMALGDIGVTALTGKSRNWSKSAINDLVGKSYYDNIAPMGYANNLTKENSRNQQIKGFVKDVFTPSYFKNDVTHPDYKPKWFSNKETPDALEMFRNDAHRLSMNLPSHLERLDDGKLHSLYKFNKRTGTYDVDYDYIRAIKKRYPDLHGVVSRMLPTDFPKTVSLTSDQNPLTGSVVANDYITMNGGFGNYTFNPSRVEQLPSGGYRTDSPITFTDTWDVQPLKDARSFMPKLTKLLTKTEENNTLGLGNVAKNVKNLELVDAFGGKPFTQKTTLLPNAPITWEKKGPNLTEALQQLVAGFEKTGHLQTLNAY